MKNTSLIIKALRTKGLTQTEISKRTGIPQPRISRWETQGTAVGDDALALTRLAVELGCDLPSLHRDDTKE
jgi:transcriptional regulator with XRE-family HTH domain